MGDVSSVSSSVHPQASSSSFSSSSVARVEEVAALRVRVLEHAAREEEEEERESRGTPCGCLRLARGIVLPFTALASRLLNRRERKKLVPCPGRHTGTGRRSAPIHSGDRSRQLEEALLMLRLNCLRLRAAAESVG